MITKRYYKRICKNLALAIMGLLPIVFAGKISGGTVHFASAAAPTADAAEYFEKQVRPLLVDQCFGCHGPKATGANGGLRMLGRADFLKGGTRGPAIVPGHPESSLLIKAVSYTATGLAMPPAARLSDKQIAIFTEWICRGAPWPAQKSVRQQQCPAASAFSTSRRASRHTGHGSR